MGSGTRLGVTAGVAKHVTFLVLRRSHKTSRIGRVSAMLYDKVDCVSKSVYETIRDRE